MVKRIAPGFMEGISCFFGLPDPLTWLQVVFSSAKKVKKMKNYYQKAQFCKS
jgi:hypothetical protein